MGEQRAHFQVIVGPNKGDALHIEPGSCRLLGRHLSENETVLMDPEGHRELDAIASETVRQRLAERKARPRAARPSKAAAAPRPSQPAPDYHRGPDIILADNAISRAHAMLFSDGHEVGVIDLASTNGTYVNNRRVHTQLLEDGDVIAVGSSEVAYSVRRGR